MMNHTRTPRVHTALPVLELTTLLAHKAGKTVPLAAPGESGNNEAESCLEQIHAGALQCHQNVFYKPFWAAHQLYENTTNWLDAFFMTPPSVDTSEIVIRNLKP